MNECALLALGGNLPTDLGTPAETIAAALKRLNAGKIRLCAVSRFFQTPCFPEGAGPDYVNAAVSVRTSLSPKALLQELHAIEADFGRAREQRWGMRTLDLDLVAYGEKVLPDPVSQAHWRDLSIEDQKKKAPDDLILPHPRLQDRAFVLGPLCDIAPNWIHPLLGKSLREIYAQLPQSDREALEPL
ncbi:2-amino-4-hydroxy-6-hydroxymethyldihydropteridine diphosphokinase [Shimia sp. W99]